MVLPTTPYGVRHLLEMAATRKLQPLDPVLETESFELIRHYVLQENAVGFQIPIGLNPVKQAGIAHLPLSEKDVPPGRLLLGQMKGRALPMAPAKFARQLEARLAELADDARP